jgi:hypothetical protein
MSRVLALVLSLALSGCISVAPERAPVATLTPPEVNVVSDYPPVKAAVIPALRELGYTVAQDAQYWTILTRPASGSTPPTRLTVTFASIRTHTRVIADTAFVRSTPQGEVAVPAPDHPDRNAIQARLDEARRAVERRPLAERRGRRSPEPVNVPAMPGAPRATIAGRAAPAPSAASVGQSPTAAQPAAAPLLQPGQTRVRL